MRDSLMLALKRTAKDANGKMTMRLHQVANALVDQAISGDVQAIKEINDRVDGKVPNKVIGDEGESPIKLLIEWSEQ